MATGAYLAAAKQSIAGKRDPVVVVRVEDVATIEEVYTTKAHWEGSAVKTNLNSLSDEGNVYAEVSTLPIARFGNTHTFSGVPTIRKSLTFTTPNYVTFPFEIKNITLYFAPGDPPVNAQAPRNRNFVFEIRDAQFGNVIATSEILNATFQPWYSLNANIHKVINAIFPTKPELSANTTYFLAWHPTGRPYSETYWIEDFVPGDLVNGDDRMLAFLNSPAPDEFISLCPKNAANTTLTTSTIDLGSTPGDVSRFEVDDIKPAGSSITYTAYADDFNPPTTSRGVVTDGALIGSVGYRYYRIKADFASTNGARGVLQEIRIVGGDSQFLTFSTHKNLPSAGARPLLPQNPVGNLSSRIEIDKPTSVGELSFKMLWTKESGDMLATGYLRNKAIQILHGFVGLASPDFETIFTGVWSDYKADHAKRIIDVSTQNVLKRFMKVKLPRETVDSETWVKTTTPLVWSGINAVQVILDLVEELGIPDRYIDRTTIEGLRDGALSSTDYNVTRTISTPEEAWKLIHQLATLCGCFVVVLPTGKMSLVLYDSAATPVATFDARYVDFGQINGGQDKLFTRQLIYYAPNVTDPGETESDYDNARLRINATSETAYSESTEHRWFDQWGASTTIISALADRWDSWQGTPRFTVAAKKVSNHHIGVLEGQIVWITGLIVPVAAADFNTPQKFKALVTKRSFNPTSCTLDFELLQITDAEAA